MTGGRDGHSYAHEQAHFSRDSPAQRGRRTMRLRKSNAPGPAVDQSPIAPRSARQLAAKRAFDLSIGVFGLGLLWPFMAVIALAIKLDSPGPVFYRQERVGLNRELFLMWKFRKMREDLPSQGPMLTLRHDYRLTRVGRVLERLKLDELPQLFDVILGTMSIVGPRPEVPKFVVHYPHLWDDVLTVKPGIFGPSQNHFRNQSETYPSGDVDIEAFYVAELLPRTLEVDAAYARNATIFTDLRLFASGILRSVLGSLTWQTVVTRRWQVANFLLMSAIGMLGMLVAHLMTGTDVGSDVAVFSFWMAALAKPGALLALRIPKALATSMTPNDFRRVTWSGLTASAVIVLAVTSQYAGSVNYVVLIFDGLFFLCAILLYKLVAYTLQLAYSARDDRRLIPRALGVATIVTAPLTMAAAITITGGGEAWTGSDRNMHVSLVLLAIVVRLAMFTILRPVIAQARVREMLLLEFPRVAVAGVVGASLLVMGPVAFGLTAPPLSLIAVDTLVFVAATLLVAAIATRRTLARDDGSVGGRLLVVGTGIELASYVSSFDSVPDSGHNLIGVATSEGHERTSEIGGRPVIGGVHNLPGILASTDIDVVIVLESSLSENEVRAITEYTDRYEVDRFVVRMLPALSTSESGAIRLVPVAGEHEVVVDLRNLARA